MVAFPRAWFEGVAIATLISRVLLLVATVMVLYRINRLISFKFPSLKATLESWRELMKIALPAAAGNMANPIGIGLVTAILATYGDTTVAAFGAATRIESFACLPMLALSAAIGPVTGQNWGAGHIDRVIKALKVSYLTCAVTSLLLIAVFWFFGEGLAGLFASEDEVRDRAADYLFLVSFSLWGYGAVIVSASAFNGIGKAVRGFSYYFLRMFVLYVPLSWLASKLADTHEVFLAIAISNGLAGIISAIYALHWLKKQMKTSKETAA